MSSIIQTSEIYNQISGISSFIFRLLIFSVAVQSNDRYSSYHIRWKFGSLAVANCWKVAWNFASCSLRICGRLWRCLVPFGIVWFVAGWSVVVNQSFRTSSNMAVNELMSHAGKAEDLVGSSRTSGSLEMERNLFSIEILPFSSCCICPDWLHRQRLSCSSRLSIRRFFCSTSDSSLANESVHLVGWIERNEAMIDVPLAYLEQKIRIIL